MLRQLSVLVQNEIGSTSKVTGILREGGFSLQALSVYDTPQFTILRLLVIDPEATAAFLESRGVLVKLTDVFAVALQDEVGYLDGLLQRLTREGIQLHYLYTTLLSGASEPVVVLDTDQREATEKVLIEAGYTLM